jgi:peptidoglycan/LPS O-acetylase OafA/YrhL
MYVSTKTNEVCPGSQYRPDIDGLRALAVLLVVAYHAFPGVFKGGFIGVDIFFVISGYLISNILIDIIYNKKSSLVNFFQRRIRRLFPSLLVILFFCLFVGWFCFTAIELEYLGKHLLASATFTSNFVLMNESGYFDTVSSTKPLLHLWSLAIEEQFYIIFPIYLCVLFKLRVNLFKGVLCLGIISLTSCLVFSLLEPTIGFYFPANRIWELLLGALLTIGRFDSRDIKKGNGVFARSVSWGWIRSFFSTLQQSSKLGNFQSVLGVTMILSGVIFLDGTSNLPAGWNIIPCLGAVLIITASHQAWLNRSIFSHPTMTWVGRISYPLYLWHWPLLSIGSILLASRPTVLWRIGIILLSVVLSHLLYVTVERWFRYGGRNKLKVSILLTLMATAGLSGYIIMLSDGFKQRPVAVQYAKTSEAVTDWHPFDSYFSQVVAGVSVKSLTPSVPPKIMFIGDSHMEQFGPLVRQLSNDHKLRGSVFFTSAGCPPIPNVFERTTLGCENNIAAIQALLHAEPTIDTIVIGACWNCYFGHETLPQVNRQSKFQYYYQTASKAESFRGEHGSQLAFKSLEEYLSDLSQRYKVYLLLDNPLGDQFSPAIYLKNRLNIRQSVDLKNTAQIDHKQLELNEYLTQIAYRSGALVLDQVAYLCHERQCTRLSEEGWPIYKDDHHLRPFYVRKMTKLFEPLVHQNTWP